MNNMFENAYFGKAYKTRDGRKAYFRHYQHGDLRPYMCLIDGEEHWYRLNGKNYVWKEDDYDNPIDIVSEWQETINEEELDRLVRKKISFGRWDKRSTLEYSSM